MLQLSNFSKISAMSAGGEIKVWVKYAKDEPKDAEDESKDDRDESESDRKYCHKLPVSFDF